MFSLLLKLKLKPFCKFQKIGGKKQHCNARAATQRGCFSLKSSLFQMLDTNSSSEGWVITNSYAGDEVCCSELSTWCLWKSWWKETPGLRLPPQQGEVGEVRGPANCQGWAWDEFWRITMTAYEQGLILVVPRGKDPQHGSEVGFVHSHPLQGSWTRRLLKVLSTILGDVGQIDLCPEAQEHRVFPVKGL